MNLIGKMLDNRYEVLEKVGNGGMATVYRAKDHVLNRYDAIKVLKDEFTTDSEFIKKFNAEAQAAASLTHPNIVQIYDVCNEDNLYYIVMELIQGKTLKEIINDEGRLPWKWSVNIAIQIASALEIAHKNNIVHRDIKPHNIIITEEGTAKVTDFGIAKAVSNSTITAFGTTIGSVHYFSPEHARGGYTDAKSDIYSLGIVMYEMLTGRVPFDADTPVSVALKQVQEEPVDPITYNESIPISVNRIILKAMQKDPNQRYQNATDMITDLELALKKPNDNFVSYQVRDENSPTQAVPTIRNSTDTNRVNRYSSNETPEEEPQKKSKNKFINYLNEHKWAKVLLTILLAVTLFLVAMFGTLAVLNKSIERPAQAVMPNVSGAQGQTPLTKDEAIKLLQERGFDVSDSNLTIEEEYSDTVEAGKVISQEPEFQGDNFQINITEPIKLVISKGQKIITLPKKMIGKELTEIQKELDELEVKYEVTEINDEKIPAGTIISVDPKEGTEMSASEKLKITVSKGSAFKDVVVPSVINKTQDQASQELSALGLVVSVSTEENASKSDGVVTSQSVTAGKTVKEGTQVAIVVNKQPTRSTLTINVNLQSVTGYVKPQPTVQNVTTNTVDENGETISTTTQVTVPAAEVENATVEIIVGDDTILKDSYPMTKTDISTSWTSSGVKDVKLKINGVTKYSQSIDFGQGNQTLNIQ